MKTRLTIFILFLSIAVYAQNGITLRPSIMPRATTGKFDHLSERTADHGIVFQIDALGTTAPTKVQCFPNLVNTTAATNTVDQNSPGVYYSAYSWKTAATAASQQVEIITYLDGRQSTTTPLGDYTFYRRYNGSSGTWAAFAYLTTNGAFNITTTNVSKYKPQSTSSNLSLQLLSNSYDIVFMDASDATLALIDGSTGRIELGLNNGATLANPGATLSTVNAISGMNKTVTTFATYVLTITDAGAAGAHGSIKLIDFPEGHIKILGGHQVLTFTETGSEISATATFDAGVGSAAVGVDNEELTGTEGDITGVEDEAALVASTLLFDTITTTDQTLDGSSTASDAYLNVAIAAADCSANSTLNVTGTVTICWILLGDD